MPVSKRNPRVHSGSIKLWQVVLWSIAFGLSGGTLVYYSIKTMLVLFGIVR